MVIYFFTKVFHDRTKVGIVKMKDPKLFKEFICKMIYPTYLHNRRFSGRIYYKTLIGPNRKVLSKMKDLNGSCLLHYFFDDSDSWTSKRPPANFHKLLKMFPNWIALPDDFGDNALTFGITCGLLNDRTILKMLKLCPKALEGRNDSGNHALHLALKLYHPVTIVLKMMEMFPHAIEVRDNDGNNALHLALKNCKPETIVLKMMEIFPHAIEVRDNDGNNALQLALKFDQSETIVLKMLALSRRNEFCNH